MDSINPAEFAANLRAEVARQNLRHVPIGIKLTEVLKTTTPGATARLSDWMQGELVPTPAEVTVLAAALEVPESRLLVSREALEARVAELEDDFRAICRLNLSRHLDDLHEVDYAAYSDLEDVIAVLDDFEAKTMEVSDG